MTIYYESSLYHHGVKGMKWGHRKARPESYTRMKKAKSDYKTAYKVYSESYNKSRNYSSRHPVSQFTNKAKKAKSDALLEDSFNKAVAYNNAKKSYKQAKKEYKAEKKADRIEKKAQKNGLSDKQKKAIKIGAAVAGTALVAYGGYKVSKLAKNKRAEQIVDDYIKKHGEWDSYDSRKTAVSKVADELSTRKAVSGLAAPTINRMKSDTNNAVRSTASKAKKLANNVQVSAGAKSIERSSLKAQKKRANKATEQYMSRAYRGDASNMMYQQAIYNRAVKQMKKRKR